MVMIGTDSHKKTHTVVAVDPVGRRLGELTVHANPEGHLRLQRWASGYGEVTFALEDCRHLTRRLEADLFRAGQRVVRVPTRLMADARRGARTPGKSDPIDAEAVAIAALRHPDLPVAELDGPAREVKLLSDHRRDLVMQRTRTRPGNVQCYPRGHHPTRRATAVLGDALDQDQTPTIRVHRDVQDPESGQREQQCRTVNHGSWLSSADVLGTNSMSRPRASNHGATPLKYEEPN